MAVPNISLRQLAYLVEIAETGSMTAAADSLLVSQATISLAINDLERRLGTNLLVRRPGRGVSLTDAGESVIDDARRVLSAVDDLYASARSPEQEIRGRVRLGCFTTITPFYVPRLLALMAARYPAVELEILEGSQVDLHRALAEGTCEMVLTYDSGLDPALSRQNIATRRPQVLLPAHHALANRPEIDVRELADEPLVQYASPMSVANTEKLLRARGIETTPVFSSSNIETVRAMVANGLGYTILVQQWPIDRSVDGLRVSSRPISGPATEFHVVAAWNNANPLSTRARAVLENIQQAVVDQDGPTRDPAEPNV
jgi:DNA-binding transcriptional LysR family regulator